MIARSRALYQANSNFLSSIFILFSSFVSFLCWFLACLIFLSVLGTDFGDFHLQASLSGVDLLGPHARAFPRVAHPHACLVASTVWASQRVLLMKRGVGGPGAEHWPQCRW